MKIQFIHDRCIASARNFKKAELQMISDLRDVIRHKVHFHFGCRSVHEYIVKKLGLSDELAYIFSRVAGKTLQVPELGMALQKGEITVSKANRLTAVLKPENQSHWLKLASTVSKNQLERKIAEIAPRERTDWVHPQNEIKEKVTFTQARIQLQAGVSEKTMLKIRRVQDLLCQQRGSAVSLEQTLEAMAEFFVDRKDPVRRAQRQKIRGKMTAEIDGSHAHLQMSVSGRHPSNRSVASSIRSDSKLRKEIRTKEPSALHRRPGLPHSTGAIGLLPGHKISDQTSSASAHSGKWNLEKKPTQNRSLKAADSRKPIPAATAHALQLRDEGQCSHADESGNRCSQKRWLHTHHIQPVAEGGTNELTNLTLLCSGHHRAVHLQMEPFS